LRGCGGPIYIYGGYGDVCFLFMGVIRVIVWGAWWGSVTGSSLVPMVRIGGRYVGGDLFSVCLGRVRHVGRRGHGQFVFVSAVYIFPGRSVRAIYSSGIVLSMFGS
jgi:hypothetical protein